MSREHMNAARSFHVTARRVTARARRFDMFRAFERACVVASTASRRARRA